MEMPQPTAEHKSLARFVGTWKGEETLFPSPFHPEERSAIGHCELRMDVGDFFLISNYEEFVDGVSSYKGHGVYGYDPQAGHFTMHWFDSMGGSYEKPAVGGWDGDSLSFQNVTPQGHARYTHTLEGEGYVFKIEVSEDGEAWTLFMMGVYERV